jgi:hypothetical protein
MRKALWFLPVVFLAGVDAANAQQTWNVTIDPRTNNIIAVGENNFPAGVSLGPPADMLKFDDGSTCTITLITPAPPPPPAVNSVLTCGGTNYTVKISSTTSVPLPLWALVALGAGLIGAAGLRRERWHWGFPISSST